jgi:hypothetical protein
VITIALAHVGAHDDTASQIKNRNDIHAPELARPAYLRHRTSMNWIISARSVNQRHSGSRALFAAWNDAAHEGRETG